MDSLLFTFSNQQRSQDVQALKNREGKLSDFLTSYQQKKQIKLRGFRSKKLKRYEQYLEDIPLDDCSFSPVKNKQTMTIDRYRIDDYLHDTIKPHSSKHIQLARRPKVSRNSRQFPSDFNRKSIKKPQSMQLIRQDGFREQQRTFKRKLKQQIQTVIAKKTSTSKDAPKINFPSSDKKLPQVFRFRSISHDKVNTSVGRKNSTIAYSIQQNMESLESSPAKKGKSKEEIYMNATKAATISNSEPTKTTTVFRRKNIASFYLNAQETPHFKQTIQR